MSHVNVHTTKLTPKRAAFCHEYVLGRNPGNGDASAKAAGFSPGTSRALACTMLTYDCIKTEIARLRERTEDKRVMSVIERKVKLSEFGRNSRRPSDSIAAIDLLNKMEKVYAEPKGGDTHNTQINFFVESPNAEAMARRVLAGERTEKELPVGNG